MCVSEKYSGQCWDSERSGTIPRRHLSRKHLSPHFVSVPGLLGHSGNGASMCPIGDRLADTPPARRHSRHDAAAARPIDPSEVDSGRPGLTCDFWRSGGVQ